MAAKLPYSRVVDVTVTRADKFPTAQGFSTAMLVISASKTGTLDASHRSKLYSSIEEVAVDWAPNTEPYKAAAIFFSARVRPPQLKMGYRDSTQSIAAEMDAIWAADSDWYWGLHTKELVDVADQRALADWAESKAVLFGLDSKDVDTLVPGDVIDAMSTVTMTIAAPGVVSWTAHGLSAGDPVSFATTGALPTGLVPGTTYYVVSTNANSFSVAASLGGSAIATTGSQSGTHTATALKFGGSIAEYVKNQNYDRSPVFYHSTDGAYLAAAAWGYAAARNLDRANYDLAKTGRIDSGQAYTMKFKTLPGVSALNLSSAAVQAVTGFVPSLGLSDSAGHFANTYINIGGVDMLVEGSVGSGAFIDEIHAVDWIKARTQESVLGVLTSNARIPYTNAGMGHLISAGVQPPLRRAFAAGILASQIGDDNEFLPEFEISVDDVANIPISQRRNRIAPDIKVKFRYAGAFHFASVTMTMQF